jgi:hypothetical protein
VCDGIGDATAVVVACDENLELAREQGFGTVERDNEQLGRRYNDGYQAAAQLGAEFVVPIGSDDWIDPLLITGKELDPEMIRCFHWCAMMSDDGTELMTVNVKYDGGLGIRVIPVGLLEPFGYRPAPEDLKRAVDTGTLKALRRQHPRLGLDWYDCHPFQLVDFKTPGANLNPYEYVRMHKELAYDQPFDVLASRYPADLVDDMRRVYQP